MVGFQDIYQQQWLFTDLASSTLSLDLCTGAVPSADQVALIVTCALVSQLQLMKWSHKLICALVHQVKFYNL